jgi:hypothetical protein
LHVFVLTVYNMLELRRLLTSVFLTWRYEKNKSYRLIFVQSSGIIVSSSVSLLRRVYKGALEGLGAAAGTLHYPTLGRCVNAGLHRNSSFNIGDNNGVPGKHSQAVSQYGAGQRNDHASHALPGGQPPASSVPSADNIVDLYKEAIIHYSKVCT